MEVGESEDRAVDARLPNVRLQALSRLPSRRDGWDWKAPVAALSLVSLPDQGRQDPLCQGPCAYYLLSEESGFLSGARKAESS